MTVAGQYYRLLSSKDNLYIYGAGTIAGRLIRFCRDYSINISGLIVTDKEGNPDKVDEIPVYGIGDLGKEELEKIDLVVAITGRHTEWIEFFKDHDFKSLILCSNSFFDYLREVYKKFEIKKKETVYICEEDYTIDSGYYGLEQNHACVLDKDGVSLCRIRMMDAKDPDTDVFSRIRNGEMEKKYGKAIRLSYKGKRESVSAADGQRKELYIVTSIMDKMVPESDRETYGVPIQVGAYFADEYKNCIRDDTGDNISYKNHNYCECTALYWMWKNTSGQDLIGLEHYRRRLQLDAASYSDIESTGADFISVIPQYITPTVKGFFSKYFSEYDWEIIIRSIIDVCPQMKEAVYEHENSHFFIPCNLGLWSRAWFDRYCEFAFAVADRIEEFFEGKGIFREDRYMGYVFENLYSLFVAFYHDEMKLAFADMEWIS